MKLPVFFIIIATIFTSCSKDEAITPASNSTTSTTPSPPATISHLNTSLTYGQVSDVDGNNYATIIIGNQEWMAENLRTTKYCNGDTIFNGYDQNLWYSNANNIGVWRSTQLTDSVNGYLYNYYAAIDSRNVCPCNWHVPSQSEWFQLIKYVDPYADTISPYTAGGTGNISNYAGGFLKSTGTNYWYSPNTGATNSSGFSAVASSRVEGGSYYPSNQHGLYWSSTVLNSNPISAFYLALLWDRVNIDFRNFQRDYGLSVRCIKD